MSTSKETKTAEKPTTVGTGEFFVLAERICVGGVFRSRVRGVQLTKHEVVALRKVPCGKGKSMFDELLSKEQIGSEKQLKALMGQIEKTKAAKEQPSEATS